MGKKRKKGIKVLASNNLYFNKRGFYPLKPRYDSVGWCALHSAYVSQNKANIKQCYKCKRFIEMGNKNEK